MLFVFRFDLQYVQSDSPVLGMQLWHLVAIIVMGICVLCTCVKWLTVSNNTNYGILNVVLPIVTVVCCFIDWRIPRTRKEIELDRQLRRMADDYAASVMNKAKEDENRDEDGLADIQTKKMSPVFKV